MIGHDEFGGLVVPFVRRRPVIEDTDLAAIVADHARLRDVCDRLEACADALPDRPSDAAALRRSLRAVVASHDREEAAVIDTLFARDLSDPLTKALLWRVRARRLSDAIHADDVLAALSELSTSELWQPCAEAFGYMLRGVFDSCRLTMDFTELAILTLGTGRLSRSARAMLVDGLCARQAG